MKILKGITASPGIVQGIVYVFEPHNVELIAPSEYKIKEHRIDREINRLKKGFSRTKAAISSMIALARRSSDKTALDILNAHLEILEDQSLYEESKKIIKKKMVTSEYAVIEAFRGYIKEFDVGKEHFHELIYDLMDIEKRILKSFESSPVSFLYSLGMRKPVVIVTERLTPSIVLEISKKRVLAFVTKEGGLTSHAAILASSYGIPVLFNIEVKENLKSGDEVIVDCLAQQLIINPDTKTKEYYSKKIEKIEKYKSAGQLQKKISFGRKSKFILKVNINSLEDVEMAKKMDHDGIGLLRTEFIFLRKKNFPSEKEHYDIYATVLKSAKGKPVTIRLLDTGSDKLPDYLKTGTGEEFNMHFRGARALERFYDSYLIQMKALLRAGVHGNLRILYPMISDISDLWIFRKLLSDAKRALTLENREFAKKVVDGIMIETPAAAIMAGELLKHVDFANIGSNDLLQYSLAVPRDMTVIEERYHILHPALVKFMRLIINEGKKLKKEICLCGVVALHQPFYRLFLELGLTSFSVPTYSYNAVKFCLYDLNKNKKEKVLLKYYSLNTKKQLDKFFAR
ncbi:MAG: phosphoenolpyruvate--protein phosphotransferase [Candidatus Omnitrophica bacterium]|nr:phosphoenolpyruvate--protein phosphotransferase [Candidatus Omnitrophota bacterium]